MIQTLFFLSLSAGTDPNAYARVVDAHLSVQTAQGKPLYRYALPKLPSDAALDEVMIDRSSKRCAVLFENNDLKWFVLWARPGAAPKLTRTGFGVRAILSTQGTGWVFDADTNSAIPPGNANRSSVEGEVHFLNVYVVTKNDQSTGSLFCFVNGAMLEHETDNFLVRFHNKDFKGKVLWGDHHAEKFGSKLADFFVENGQTRIVTRAGQVMVQDANGWKLEATVGTSESFAWINPNCIVALSPDKMPIVHRRQNSKAKFTQERLQESIFDRYRVRWLGLVQGEPVTISGYAGDTPVWASLDAQGNLGEVRRYRRESGRIAVSFE